MHKPSVLAIVTVTSRDREEIVNLGEKISEACIVPMLDDAATKTLRDNRKIVLEDVADNKICSAMKAMVDGKIIGFVAWRAVTSITQQNMVYVTQLYVDCAYQNKGIGRQLIKHVLIVTRASQIDLKSTINALGFYNQLGFNKTAALQHMGNIPYFPMSGNANNITVLA